MCLPIWRCGGEDRFRINLQRFQKNLERESKALRRIYFLAGEEFNINSPKQLSKILFHSLGFQPGKKTKTGFSTEMGVLEELAETMNSRGRY